MHVDRRPRGPCSGPARPRSMPSSSPEETSTIAKLSGGGRAQRDLAPPGSRPGGAGTKVPARSAPAAQLAGALEAPRRGASQRGPRNSASAPERALVGGAEQVRAVDRGALVVEDGGLHRALEEVLGVAAEELVERVLAGDVDRQSTAPAPGPAPHLAQRGDRAGEGDDDRRVELADVDPQLERVGRDHRPQLAAASGGPRAPAAAGRCSRRGRARPAPPARDRSCLERPLDERAQHLDALARLHEADRARAIADQLGQQLGRLAERRAARAELPRRSSGGFQIAIRRCGAGEPSSVDQPHVLQARQPLGELARVGDRRGARAGSAARCRRRRRSGAAGAARWRRGSRTRRGRRGPRRSRRRARLANRSAQAAWLGRMPTWSMSGLVSTTLARRRISRAGLARRVAVVDRGRTRSQPERGQRARLVLGERLGGVEVERPRPAIAAEDLERRQVEAQRLARGGSRRDDRRALPGRLQRLGLVGVEAARCRPARAPRAGPGAAPSGSARRRARAGPLAGLAHEAAVLAARVQQRAPRLRSPVERSRT